MLTRLKYPFQASPNHSLRPDGLPPRATVIHYTGSGKGAAGDLAWMCDPASQVSAHFLVARDGAVTQLVDLNRQAWHAGKSQLEIDGKMRDGCNAFTIGIELDNQGVVDHPVPGFEHAMLVYDSGRTVEGWWEPYPYAQIEALVRLLSSLQMAGYLDAATDLVGHEEIAPTRKSDPGPLFPWERLTRVRERMTHRMAA